MNTRAAINDSPPPAALSVAYNSNCTNFSVALKTGFRVYDAAKCKLVRARDLGQGFGCVEMVDGTNILALVGNGKDPRFAPNKVIIWDESKQSPSESIEGSIEFNSPVQRVRLNKQYLVAVLHNAALVYRLSRSPALVGSYKTADNDFGLCCLNEDTVVFPGPNPGQVHVLKIMPNPDAEANTGTKSVCIKTIRIILAHDGNIHSLRALSLSPDGTIIATASDKGTLVRLWHTSSGAKIGEFRRGVQDATIFSIALSPSNEFMAVTSDTGTLHIFDLPYAKHPSDLANVKGDFSGAPESGNGVAEPSASPKWGFLSKVPILPRIFSDIYSTASAKFEIGNEPELSATFPHRRTNSDASARKDRSVMGGGLNWNTPIPGVAGGRPPKGVVGWLNDLELLVIGAGQDARWEMFRVTVTDDGRRAVQRLDWKNIMD